MTETPQHQQRHQDPPAHNADHGSRTSGGHNRLHQTGQARQVQPGQPAHHRVIPHRDRHAQAAPGRAKYNLGQRDKNHRRGHPPQAGAMNATRQRWRLTGRTPPPTRPPGIRRTRGRWAHAARGHPPRGSSHAVILRPNRLPVHISGRQPATGGPPGPARWPPQRSSRPPRPALPPMPPGLLRHPPHAPGPSGQSHLPTGCTHAGRTRRLGRPRPDRRPRPPTSRR
jgi:hypothetical protein